MNNLLGVILAVCAVAFLPLPLEAKDFLVCHDCHKEALEKDTAQKNLHIPFTLKQCGDCHAANVSVSLPKPITFNAPASAPKVRQKINWLEKSSMLNSSHWFLLSGDKEGHTLVVETHGAEGKFSRHEIVVPTLAYLPEVINSDKTPEISNLRVIKVERGVFLKVTIGWQTNILSDAFVRYGVNDLSQMSDPSRRFGRQHQVILHNLQPDMLYRFTAVAHDLFGHSQVSEPMTFSTSKPFMADLPNSLDNFQNKKDADMIISSFQRLGADYLLELSLEQPAAILIGSKGVIREQNLSAENNAPMGGDNEFHTDLSSEIVVSMQACLSCHQFHSKGSHPVNVYPKPDMTVPPEYPTLPDGRITCRSCHTPHSSDYKFLTRKRGKRELCVGCHSDML